MHRCGWGPHREWVGENCASTYCKPLLCKTAGRRWLETHSPARFVFYGLGYSGDRMAEITAGLTARLEQVVEMQHTAAHIGSGTVLVLSTPMLIAFMEETSHLAVSPHLTPAQS